MTKYKVEKYLKKLTNGTSFWFHVGIASDESEIGLDIHGENPENEDWQWYFPIKNSDDKKDLLEAIKKEIEDAVDCFDIEENVYRMLEAKRNGFQGVPNVVNLVANEQYKEKALREFYQRLDNWKDEIDLKNPESKKIANILFNMHLDLDYDSCIDDYKEELDMLSQTIDKLSEGNDPLFYVLQTIAGQHEDEENLLVDGDGDFVER
jgi:hypothetical protein